MKRLPAGTEITCPKCSRVMCRLKVDLHSGDRLTVDLFESVEDQIIDHKPMICPFDGQPYFRSYGYVGELHTKDGWV